MHRFIQDVRFGIRTLGKTLAGIQAGDTMRQTLAEVVSSNYFDTLGAPLVSGRTFTAHSRWPALLATWLPARRATRVTPLTALRE